MSDVETMILDSLDKWLEKDVRPHASELEHRDEYPHEMVEQMRTLGLFGATIGTEWGGLGLPVTTYSKIVTRICEYGYNAATDEYGDMIEMGILDPTKVVRYALQNAASISGLLLTTEAMVAEAPKDDAAPAMPDMGGMGGMGGMM